MNFFAPERGNIPEHEPLLAFEELNDALYFRFLEFLGRRRKKGEIFFLSLSPPSLG